jgi:hypothetical protein
VSIETINAGDTIAQLRTKLINNFDYLAALLNGNLDGTNFQYLGGSGHGNLSYIYEPLHIDQSIYRPDGDTLEDALDDAYERVTGIRETGEMLPVFFESKIDETTYSGGAGFSQIVFPNTEVTIPSGTATYGIMIMVNIHMMRTFAITETTLPIMLNGVDLVGARWTLRCIGQAAQHGPVENAHHATIVLADGWDPDVENTVRMGTLAGSYLSVSRCTFTVYILR